MGDHIFYAMANEEARNHFFNFNFPSELLDWSFLVVESVMIIGAVLAIIHAFRYSKKEGNNSAIYTFAGIFIYGLVMDISSYYLVDSFYHSEFSVMLVWNRLPLYIAMLYPALIYHTYMTIRRFNFTAVTEAICVGFYSSIIYMIFDNLGPSLNWWIWNRDSIYNQPFLDTVPVTSYHWLFLFTGALAFCLRKFAWDALAAGNTAKARIGTAFTPILTILLGCILFMPYNLFLFIFDNLNYVAVILHAVGFFFSGYWFLLHYKKSKERRDSLLMFFPLVLITTFLYIYIAKFESFYRVTAEGLNADGLAPGNFLVAIMAIIIGTVITLKSHAEST